MITFVEADGTRHRIEAWQGQSVMAAALAHRVPGILGECGGRAHCGTCHVYVDETWRARLPRPESREKVMLDYVSHRRASSRLACQLPVTPELEGLVVHLPVSQGDGPED